MNLPLTIFYRLQYINLCKNSVNLLMQFKSKVAAVLIIPIYLFVANGFGLAEPKTKPQDIPAGRHL